MTITILNGAMHLYQTRATNPPVAIPLALAEDFYDQ